MKSIDSSYSGPQASNSIGTLARGPSTERLKALSAEHDSAWVKGVSFADWCGMLLSMFVVLLQLRAQVKPHSAVVRAILLDS